MRGRLSRSTWGSRSATRARAATTSSCPWTGSSSPRGIYQPAPDQLDRLRRAIDDGRTAAALTRAIARAQQAGLALTEPALVRAPRGYAADHPRLRLLRCKSLTVTRRHELGAWLHRPKAGRTIREELDAAAPLVRWVRERVGPSQRAR